MPGKAAKVIITERQQQVLQTMTRSSTCPQALALRAHMILLAFERWDNESIAERLDFERHQVGIWRHRWATAFKRLVLIECCEKPSALREAIEDLLSDSPRRGCPGKFTAEQVTQILAVACEPPEDSGRPVTHWTARELADEVIQRGIVPSISPRHVGRFLSAGDLKPHLSRYWLNAKPKDPEVFQQQVEAVCACYLAAPERWEKGGIHTISVDEMTGIQALERIAPTKPMRPGEPARVEFEYKRNGTQCLIGNFDVVTGQVLAPTVQDTRTEEDFAKHIAATVATDPEAGWIIVSDNLTTHCSETLVRDVAAACGISEDLGKKGKSGVLKSVPTRKKFLIDPSHRIRFVYVPKHTSWLNQVEIWFSILVRRVIRRGHFPSKADLREKILSFIDYFNRTMAKPFKWTFTGRPLNV